MENDVKAPDAPQVEATADEPIIVNPREVIENKVITENDTFTLPTTENSPTPAEAVKDEIIKPEESEVDRIKKSVQKRIDKVVAKQKSAEERLAEAEAELALLRSKPQSTETPTPKDNAPPTPEQVEAYIVKCREEGDVVNEVKATRYLIQLEKEQAIKEIEGKQKKVLTEAQDKANQENQQLLDLAKDYVVLDKDGNADMKSDLTLANQNGKLFKVAMGLYNDPELKSQYYNDPNRAYALRRAVADAYRELHQKGMLDTPKDSGIETRRMTRQVLVDPSSVEADETSTQSNQANLSDADKVREEIKQRNKMRNSRTLPNHR